MVKRVRNIAFVNVIYVVKNFVENIVNTSWLIKIPILCVVEQNRLNYKLSS